MYNKPQQLQALERVSFDDFWITILMVVLLLAVFMLKVLSPHKLKGYAFSMFSKTFVEDEIEENTSFFNPFHGILFLFAILVLSLVTFNLTVHFKGVTVKSFSNFCLFFAGVFGYFALKWLLEYVFSLLFMIRKPIKFFLVSKTSYLYSVSFYLFITIVLVEYSQLKHNILIYISITLFSIRFLLHVLNNKKLIFSKLFYFILYLCAFEIAPLLILFKLMF